MAWTKRQIIESAFEELGYSDYSFDLNAKQYENALNRLDAMVSSWKQRGLVLDYVVPTTKGGSDLDDDTLIEYYFEALYLNLAVRVAPMIGKTPSRETKQAANRTFRELMNDSVTRLQTIYSDDLPVGAGNRGIEAIMQSILLRAVTVALVALVLFMSR